MGKKKNGILEKIKEGDRLGREALESGEQLEGDGSEIKALLDGIDTSMDEDDLAAVKSAEAGYSADFKATFQENVGTKASHMKSIEGEASDSAGEELDKVNDAADKFEEMSRITEIGRNRAEGTADKMKSSAAEYADFVSEAISIVEDTKEDVASLKSSIDSIFG